MHNLENLNVFDILITQKLLKCPKDPFVRLALICFRNRLDLVEIYEIEYNRVTHLIWETIITRIKNKKKLLYIILLKTFRM